VRYYFLLWKEKLINFKYYLFKVYIFIYFSNSTIGTQVIRPTGFLGREEKNHRGGWTLNYLLFFVLGKVPFYERKNIGLRVLGASEIPDRWSGSKDLFSFFFRRILLSISFYL